MSEELKPCPFCGSSRARLIFVEGGGGLPAEAWVKCDSFTCDATGNRFQTARIYETEGIKADAISAWNTRTPPGNAEDLREAVARIVDPIAFKSWQSLYEYCQNTGDTEEWSRHAADGFHKKSCDHALAKADAIIALLPSKNGPEVVDLPEAFESWWAMSSHHNRRMIGYSDKKSLAYSAFEAGALFPSIISKLADAK